MRIKLIFTNETYSEAKESSMESIIGTRDREREREKWKWQKKQR